MVILQWLSALFSVFFFFFFFCLFFFFFFFLFVCFFVRFTVLLFGAASEDEGRGFEQVKMI